jgi:hypothetical protein
VAMPVPCSTRKKDSLDFSLRYIERSE